MKRAKAKNGDTILLGGERFVVREVDQSVLARNLGMLVCPADEWEQGDDSGSRWVPHTSEYEVVKSS